MMLHKKGKKVGYTSSTPASPLHCRHTNVALTCGESMFSKSFFFSFFVLVFASFSLSGCGGSSGSGSGCSSSSSASSSSSNGSVVGTTPDVFSFVAQSAVSAAMVVESNGIRMSGIDVPTSVIGECSLADAPCSTSTGFIENGQILRLRVQSANVPAITSVVTVNVGGVTAAFTVTTLADTAPPEATITFPAGNATEQYRVTTVSGAASDDFEVAALSVNGVVVSTSDNFKTWSVSLPLEVGLNTLGVSVTGSAGKYRDRGR